MHVREIHAPPENFENQVSGQIGALKMHLPYNIFVTSF
jgi:hypothetical protein